MTALRSYHPNPEASLGGEIVLDEAESHHLVKVRRAGRGSAVTVFDGSGNEWRCAVRKADSKAAGLQVLSHKRRPPPDWRITLAFGLAKSKTADLIIQKTVELGAFRLIPVLLARGEVRLSGTRAAGKAKKWQSAAIEACKQSGNPFLPEIAPVQSLDAFLSHLPAAALKLAASPEGRPGNLMQLTREWRQNASPPYQAVWLIGPEGGLTAAEENQAGRNGFIPVWLGPYILRAETAAAAAMSASHQSAALTAGAGQGGFLSPRRFPAERDIGPAR